MNIVLKQRPPWFLIIATLFYLTFWIQTDWTIEDGMIVARVARNFASYGILSYNTTSWVSSCTSALFAFIVGVLALIGIPPLVGAKIVGMLAALVGGWILYKAALGFQCPHHASITAAIYMLLPTTVAYATCGLETPLYTLACMIALFSIPYSSPHAALIMGAIATIIRPDGLLVLFIVTVGIWWREKKFRARWIMPAVIILVAFFAIHYGVYRTWIPHSMIAKAQVYQVKPLKNIERYLERMFLSQKEGLVLYALAFWGVWLVRKNWHYLWLVAWYVVYHLAFMLRAPLFDWYLHPPVFVIIFFAGIAIGYILSRFERGYFHRFLNHNYSGVYELFLKVLIVSVVFIVNFQYAKVKLCYRIYEREVREAAGRWLALNTSPTDLVFTESLGYIGFFSQNHFVDWPGLVDTSVPNLVKNLSRIEGYKRIIEAKKPRYLVLRDGEWDSLKGAMATKYKVVAQFPSPFPEYPGYIIAKRK